MTDQPRFLDAEILRLMFADVDNRYNIREEEDDDSGITYLPDGSQAVICTSWAGYVRRELGDRAVIRGFDVSENPESEIARDFDGHDFAVVDGRYIVDVWAQDMGFINTIVVDLLDAEMSETVHRLYGPEERWVVNIEYQDAIDNESPAARAAAMDGVDFTPRQPLLAP